MISERQRLILFEIVRQFVQTGEPIASSGVLASGVLSVSSATIRNAMSDMESMGLLRQPHTSSGRVPTSNGLRLYVDALAPLERLTLSASAITQIEGEIEAIDMSDGTLEEAARRAGGVLSEVAHLTSIVSFHASPRLQDIHLSPLSDRRVLVVLVTDDERVYQRVVRLEDDLASGALRRIEQQLASLVVGLTLEQVRLQVRAELERAERAWSDTVRLALQIGSKALEGARPSMYVEGTYHVLDHAEFTADTERLRALLEILEERERMLELLDRLIEPSRPTVLIGSEIDLDVGDHLSLIVCGYHRGGEPVGWLGLLGPLRLDYARIIPLVHRSAIKLSERLEE